MKYENIKKSKFIDRPNRFIANIEVNGTTEICHVKNTGRCKELLVSGADIYVQKTNSETRKTKYDLISVYKNDILVNMDSQVPNKVVLEFIKTGGIFKNTKEIKCEKKYKNSRFDLYVKADGKENFVEVKGVTLEENGVARFPDAPTERGIKHINELVDAAKNGYGAYVVFVIQLKGVKYFEPNYKTHKAFADALLYAKENGVEILAYDCIVTKNSIKIDKEIKVEI